LFFFFTQHSIRYSREIPDLMENPVLKKIANHVNKSPAQVLLRYLLERGLSAIPKSTNFNRLKQNMDVFDFSLDADDMKALAELDQGVRVCDFAFFKG
jgi:diketogulonate reductase-like aldo/keto reductase